MANERRGELQDRILGWHRAPLKVAVVALVGWLLIWDSGRTAFATDQGTRPWLDWIVLACIAYSAAAQLVLIPCFFTPKALQRAGNSERGRLTIASMRLACAANPVVFGFALLAAGADQWVATAALLASALLLIPYVRRTQASLSLS